MRYHSYNYECDYSYISVENNIFNGIINQKIGKLFNIFKKRVDPRIVIDIGTSLTLLDIELSGEPVIHSLKVIPLNEAKREETILNSLRDFIRKNKIQHSNAILGLSLKSLLIKRIQLPAIPQSELAEAIKWQLKDELKLEKSGEVMDFYILKETGKADGSKLQDVMCVLAQEQEVRSSVLLLKELGLRCLAVMPRHFGYPKLAQKYLTQSPDEIVGILDIEEDSGYISFHKKGKFEFFREVPLAINKLKEALSTTLATERGTIKLSNEDIDNLLFKHGIPQEDNLLYKDKIARAEILSMLRPVLERIVGEIKLSLSYYESQFQGEAVKKMFVMGLAQNIPHIDKYLSSELPLKIEKFSLAGKIKVPSSVDQGGLSGISASFGLALDYDKNINLLPYEFRTEEFEYIEKLSLRWVAFFALIILVFSYLFSWISVSAYKKRLNNALFHLSTLSEINEIKTSVDAFNNFITAVTDMQTSVTGILKRISNIAAKELFVETLSINCDSKTGVISGVVKNADQNLDEIVTKFSRDLQSSNYVTDATISSTEHEKEDSEDIVKFNINFKLR